MPPKGTNIVGFSLTRVLIFLSSNFRDVRRRWLGIMYSATVEADPPDIRLDIVKLDIVFGFSFATYYDFSDRRPMY